MCPLLVTLVLTLGSILPLSSERRKWPQYSLDKINDHEVLIEEHPDFISCPMSGKYQHIFFRVKEPAFS